jgi:hypothetical protein
VILKGLQRQDGDIEVTVSWQDGDIVVTVP